MVECPVPSSRSTRRRSQMALSLPCHRILWNRLRVPCPFIGVSSIPAVFRTVSRSSYERSVIVRTALRKWSWTMDWLANSFHTSVTGWCAMTVGAPNDCCCVGVRPALLYDCVLLISQIVVVFFLTCSAFVGDLGNSLLSVVPYGSGDLFFPTDSSVCLPASSEDGLLSYSTPSPVFSSSDFFRLSHPVERVSIVASTRCVPVYCEPHA